MRGVTPSKSNARGEAAAPIGAAEAAVLFHAWRDASGVLIAVSGGPDSIAMLGLAARWRDDGGTTPLYAATFDHRLRPESAREARLAKDVARALGVEHRTLKWAGDKPASRLHERARDARYGALARLAHQRKLGCIALAHHQDDQAETALMRIAAGTGVAGLGAMRELSTIDGVTLHRPFLALSKARLVATCRAHGWPFVDDPSNADDRFARARWRRLSPMLAAEGLSAERLARLAARARRADEALAAMTDAWLTAHPPTAFRASLILRSADWSRAPAEIRLRVLSALIEKVGAEVSEATPERLERLERLCEDLQEAALADRPFSRNLRGVLVRRDRMGALSFAPEPPRRSS